MLNRAKCVVETVTRSDFAGFEAILSGFALDT